LSLLLWYASMKTTFCFVLGGRYVVVDCGGGTVDITVHEIDSKDGHLKELFRATGGAYGSVSE
jgi:molecular chaperone DnaK (HSP70)